MAASITVPQAVYVAGTYGPFAVAIPSGDSEGFFRATNVGWPAAARVEAIAEISLDAGSTWLFLASQTLTGGSWGNHRITGLPVTESNLRVSLPGVGNTNRQIRGRAVVSGATVTSAITVGSV